MSITIDQLGDNDFAKKVILDLVNRVEYLEGEKAAIKEVVAVPEKEVEQPKTMYQQQIKSPGRPKRR